MSAFLFWTRCLYLVIASPDAIYRDQAIPLLTGHHIHKHHQVYHELFRSSRSGGRDTYYSLPIITTFLYFIYYGRKRKI